MDLTEILATIGVETTEEQREKLRALLAANEQDARIVREDESTVSTPVALPGTASEQSGETGAKQAESDEPEPDESSEIGQSTPDWVACAGARARLKKPWMRRFIDTLAESGHLGTAAAAARLSVAGCDHWKQRDPDFRQAWEDVMRCHVIDVEASVFTQAKSGKSERLAEFILKSHMRQTYGEKLDLNVNAAVAHIHVTSEDIRAAVLASSPTFAALKAAGMIKELPESPGA